MKKISLLFCLLLLALLYLGQVANCAAGVKEGEEAIMKKDYTTALKIFKPLAEKGDAEAQDYLGGIYLEGTGVAKNYAQALKWFTRAAEQGDCYGQNSLGTMYKMGTGVPVDKIQAFKWLSLAGDINYPPDSERMEDPGNWVWIVNAYSKLLEVTDQMTPQQIAEGKRLAKEFKPKKEAGSK